MNFHFNQVYFVLVSKIFIFLIFCISIFFVMLLFIILVMNSTFILKKLNLILFQT
jgi:hypothetical protein